MDAWSSKQRRLASAYEPHTEGRAEVARIVRTAGYLTAVSASGVIVDVDEIIGAKSQSQRYVFLANLTNRAVGLRNHSAPLALHDGDKKRRDSDMANRLASMRSCIVDAVSAGASTFLASGPGSSQSTRWLTFTRSQCCTGKRLAFTASRKEDK